METLPSSKQGGQGEKESVFSVWCTCCMFLIIVKKKDGLLGLEIPNFHIFRRYIDWFLWFYYLLYMVLLT